MLSGGYCCPHYTDEEMEAKWLVSCRVETGFQLRGTPGPVLFAGPASPCGSGVLLQPSPGGPWRPCPGAEPSQRVPLQAAFED